MNIKRIVLRIDNQNLVMGWGRFYHHAELLSHYKTKEWFKVIDPGIDSINKLYRENELPAVYEFGNYYWYVENKMISTQSETDYNLYRVPEVKCKIKK